MYTQNKQTISMENKPSSNYFKGDN